MFENVYQVMLDTIGPEVQVLNQSGNPIELEVDNHVTITTDLYREPSSMILRVNYTGLAMV